MTSTALETPPHSVHDLERKARRDFFWTCQHLLKILPKDQPIMPLRLNWPQRYIAEHYLIPAHQRGLPIALSILKARREGVSTLISAWHYHKIRWYRGRRAMVYAHDDDTLAELFSMIGRFHDYLPEALQIPTAANNTRELEYAGLDSRMGKRVAGYKDVGRGKTIHHAHLSEVDFYDDPTTVMAGVVEAVPTTGPSTLILETTANGDGGYFHQHWEALKKKRGSLFSTRHWFPIFLPWFWHQEHRAEPPRDWEPEAEDAEMQVQYKLDRAQVFWYARKGEELETLNPGRGTKLRLQEYPSCADEAFLQSGDCIFSEAGLDAIKAHRRPPALGFQLVRLGDKQFALQALHPLDAPFQVWEPPQPGYQYALGVDVAHGRGGDDSAIEVIRMPGFVQVAEWYDNYTSPRQLAYVVACLAEYYAGNRPVELPYVNVEINDAGLLTNDELMLLIQQGGNFQPYVYESFDRLAPAPITSASRTGWLTNHISKNILIGVANTLLGETLVQVPSASLQAEMHRTMEIAVGYVQTRGADQVMAWLLALVCAYRKIARWAWPGMGMARRSEENAPDRPRVTSAALQDNRAGTILQPPMQDGWEGLPGGDGSGHWLGA